MWATVPLAVSIIGILGLLGLKHIELRQGRVFFADARGRFDRRVLRALVWIRSDVPRVSRHLVSEALHHVAVQVGALALALVRFMERKLTRFVNMVKGRRQLRNGNGTNSKYLRDITNHRDEVRRANGYHGKK